MDYVTVALGGGLLSVAAALFVAGAPMSVGFGLLAAIVGCWYLCRPHKTFSYAWLKKGGYLDESGKLVDEAFKGRLDLEGVVVLPNGVTCIGNEAFDGCSNITSIIIPEGTTSIGRNSFYGCSGLSSIALPAGLESIGRNAFYGCTGATSLRMAPGVTTIGETAFYRCSSITSITIPAGVTRVGASAFYGCGKAVAISIPPSVTSLSDHVFRGCSSVRSIRIPEGVTSIGRSAFYGCSAVESLSIPVGVSCTWQSGKCFPFLQRICSRTLGGGASPPPLSTPKGGAAKQPNPAVTSRCGSLRLFSRALSADVRSLC